MRINPIDPAFRNSKRKRENDSKYLAYIRTQPCVICGQFREWLHGEGRSQAAHVTIGGRAIKGAKVLYSAVPLCDTHHKIQHQQGYSHLMPHEWWINQADMFKTKFFEKNANCVLT